MHLAFTVQIKNATLRTSKPLSRPVKASFNLLLADRILSTTVPIKVRCSSEMEALCNVSISISGTSGFLEGAEGVRTPFKGICLLDLRVVSGYISDSPGFLLLVPVGAAHPGPWTAEVSPSGLVFIVPRTAC